MMQLAPAATELPQSLLLWNCREILTELIESAVVPVLVSLTALGPLVVLISREGKLTAELGEKFTAPVLIIMISPRILSLITTSSLPSPLKSPTSIDQNFLPAG